MPLQNKLDRLYMNIASEVAVMSHATRAKVGAVIANADNILSYGWNGMPRGDNNQCEVKDSSGEMVTRPEVLHAESNALMKLVSTGGVGTEGATLYVTLSPCKECAKLIKQAKIRRVVYRDQYRDLSGIDFLRERNVHVIQMKE